MERNKDYKIDYFSARIILRNEDDTKKGEKESYPKWQIKQIMEELDKIEASQQRGEAYTVLDYLVNGWLIELQEGEIHLFPRVLYGRRVRELWKISNNPELFALLKQLVQS